MNATSHPAFSVVADMEDDICNLRRVATLLRILTESDSQIDPEALGPLAGLLHEMGGRLHKQFEDAFSTLKVRS